MSHFIAVDPIEFQREFWPDVYLYDRQREIVYSVEENDETVVPAANQVGKDYIAGHIAVSFLCRYPVVRVVTSSVDQGQLEKVLWGEINRWIQTSRYELPLNIRHCDVRKVVGGRECPISYLIGRVAAREEGLLGHHAPHTLMIYDEASGVPHGFKQRTDTWAKKTLVIGNCYECSNFFRYAVQGRDPDNPDDPGGDIPKETPTGVRSYHRRVIRIRAEDSPNVRYALSQQARGFIPDDRILVPGVLSWGEYQRRRRLWSQQRQTVSLDAQFYQGADELLYPPQWVSRAEQVAESLRGVVRKAKALGVDSAEGGDDTAWTVVDELGVIEQVVKKTPDTAVICGETIALIKKYKINPRRVFFDRGGGGKQHADRLRRQGFPVRTVAFGGSVTQELKRGYVPFETRSEESEQRYVYKNRRAQMYHLLRLRLDPVENPRGFGIPRQYTELTRQMGPIPLKYDDAGRIYMIPKQKSETGRRKSLVELIGNSPDELDSLVLAVFGLHYRPHVNRAGAL